jgi:hypothetical protein
MKIILALFAGIIALVPCIVVGTMVGYRVVKWRGVSDFEGKAGFYAFFFGGIPAGLAGAIGVVYAIIRYG